MVGQNLYTELKERIARIEHAFVGKALTPLLFKEKNIQEAIQQLEDLARDKRFDILAHELNASLFFKEKAKRLRQFYEFFEVFLETEAYLENMVCEILLDNPQLKRTFEFAQQEGFHSEMNKDSRVLFVGSGPFPETALAYATHFHCQVTCLDYSPEAVLLSSRLIEKKRLQNNLQVVYGDAVHFDYQGYSHIVIAALAHPKKAILQRICDTATKNVTIICRNVEGIKSLIYEPADDLLLEHFDLIEKIYGSASTIVHSLILRHIPHTPIQYRALDTSEAQHARVFCLQIIKEEYGFEYRPDWHEDLDLLGTKKDLYAPQKRGLFLIARDDGKIIGTGGLRSLITKPLFFERFKDRYKGLSVASLWRVYVNVRERSKGIGTQLVQLLEAEAKKREYTRIYLHTSRKNPSAVRFWIEKGYKIFLEEDNEEKTVHMDKELTK